MFFLRVFAELRKELAATCVRAPATDEGFGGYGSDRLFAAMPGSMS
jgi:hypothetical protein